MTTRRRGLAQARKAAGHTQESLAEAMEVDRTTIIRWEAGENEPQPTLWPKLIRVLGITHDELRRLLAESADDDASPVPPAITELMHHDRPVIDRRAVLIGSAAAALMLSDAETLRRDLTDAVDHAAMSDATLDDWEHTVFQYQLAFAYRPAASLLADLTADITELQRLLNNRRAILVPTRLTRVVAQLAGLMTAALLRLDQHAAARNWARVAKTVAHEAGDTRVHAAVLSQEAYSYRYDGDLARAAIIADPQDQLPGIYFYNEANFAISTAVMHTQLRRTGEAFRAQDRALALYPASDRFNRALILLDRAECHVIDDDIPAAAQSITQALDTGDANPVIHKCAREVLTRVPTAAATLPDVQDLRERLHSTAP